MTESEWLNHPSIKDMDPKKKEILILLIQNTKGKSLTQSLPLIMAAIKELQNHNLSFSETEQNLLFDILSQDLSPQEKAQAMKLKQLSRQHMH